MSRFFRAIRMGCAASVMVLGANTPLKGQEDARPDYLEPIPAYRDDGYGEVVFKALIKDHNPFLWMIGRPSFEPEYAIEIDEWWERDASGIRQGPTTYFLRYSIAQNPIWHWRLLPGGRASVLDLRKHVRVRTIEAPLPAEAAKTLGEAWVKVLRNTHYSDGHLIGMDGEVFEFYAHYNLFGGTWSPRSGSPRMMVDLGHLLIEYAKADAPKRREVLSQCLQKAEEIKAYHFQSESSRRDTTPRPASAKP